MASSGPHDAVFRRVLGEPVHAASQLRAVLPAGLVERLDLDRLERVPGTFVDDSLTSRQSDLLFRAPLLDDINSDAPGEVLVYVLVEHQSSQDPLMAFRMLRYVVRIWEAFIRDHSGDEPGPARLPPVIPIVVYQGGRRSWSAPTEVLDLIDLEPDLAGAVVDFLPRLRFVLDDLTTLDEAVLRARPLTAPARLTLWLLKTAPGNPGLGEDLAAWSADLAAVLGSVGGLDVFMALLRYIELVGETPARQLQDLVAGLGPEAEEAYMTTAEMLRAEGEARGEARGRAEGEARGRAEGEARGEARGRADALAQLLTLRFGPLPQSVRDRLQSASTDQLAAWTTRVLTADNLEDVLD